MHLVALVLLAAVGPYPPPQPPCYPPNQVHCGFVLNVGAVCTCDAPPPRPTAERGTFTPHLMVTHVVYAVPGRSSFVSYQAGNTIGSTITNTDSWRNEMSVTLSQDTNFLGAAMAGFRLSLSNWQEGGTTKVSDMSETWTSTYRKPGESDGVDHDLDEIWFLARPTLNVIITPDDAFWGPGSVTWGLNPDAPTVTYYLLEGEVNGHLPIPSNVQQFLDSSGITAEDIQNLRAVDPFGADPTKNPATDGRFQLVAQFPYVAPAHAGDLPNTQTYDVKSTNLSSTQRDSSASYIVDMEIHGGAGFIGLARARLGFENKFTWKNSSSRKDYSSNNADDLITVGQPAFGYSGPTVLRVYEDTIFRTYVSHLDWN